MGIISRFLSEINISMRDPGELDYLYDKMRDELHDVKRGIADLTTEKKRLEKIEERRQEASTNLSSGDFSEQLSLVEQTREELLEQKEQLEQKIEAIRTRRETQRARYEASRTSNRVIAVLRDPIGGKENPDALMERTLERVEEIESNREELDKLSKNLTGETIETLGFGGEEIQNSDIGTGESEGVAASKNNMNEDTNDGIETG